MEVFYINTIARALSSSYIGDDDLTVRGTKIQTEEGIDIFAESYLLSAVSTKINNYSSLILTKPQSNNDIFDLKSIDYPRQNVFTTSIKSNTSGKFLKQGIDYNVVQFSNISDDDSIFELEIISDTVLQIAHQRVFNRYYLNFNGTSFYFSSDPSYVYSRFNYLIDNEQLYLFVKQGQILYSIGVDATTDTLILDSQSNWRSNYFNINQYIQDLEYNFDTSWAAYDVTDRNSLLVTPEMSRSNLQNNNLFYSNYTYITGNSITTNFFTLKNQHTHKNFSYRADNLNLTDRNVPNVRMREYTGMYTGVDQERGSESITLTYEFYNTDYRFKSDTYTTFRMSESMYPFKQLNVNDTVLVKNGAIGGDTPYTSDRIFFNDTRPGKSDGQYLCTWLSAASPDGPALWVDRYYIPEKMPSVAALTARSFYSYNDPINNLLDRPLAPSAYYDAPFVYTTLSAEIAHTPQTLRDVLYGEYFFDKLSNLVFVPEQTYVYYRIGNNYVSSVLESLSSNLIQNGLSMKTAKGVDKYYTVDIDDIQYELNNDSYALVESFRKTNTNRSFTTSFWLESDDWTTPFGHEIVGNHNDAGFGVFNDEKVTPIIMVQDGRQVTYLNTDFEVVDAVYLSQDEFKPIVDVSRVSNGMTITTTTTITSFYVKEIARTDHLDVNLPIMAIRVDTDQFTTYDNIVVNQCGVISTEDYTPISPDNVFTTSLNSITGIEIEQCQYSIKQTLL